MTGHAERATATATPSERRDEALADRAGDGDVADGEQVVEVEVQADAEHQQDDADLGELLGERGVADEAGGVRADRDAGEQIADDGREAEPLRDAAQHPRGGERGGDGRDERQVVWPAGREG